MNVADCLRSRLTNENAAVIVGNRRRDHEFVIIAPVFGENAALDLSLTREAFEVEES